MQILQIDVNCCKCEFPIEGLVLKIERYEQRLTQGYNALGGSYSCAPGMQMFLQIVEFSLQIDRSGRPVLTKGERPKTELYIYLTLKLFNCSGQCMK